MLAGIRIATVVVLTLVLGCGPDRSSCRDRVVKATTQYAGPPPSKAVLETCVASCDAGEASDDEIAACLRSERFIEHARAEAARSLAGARQAQVAVARSARALLPQLERDAADLAAQLERATAELAAAHSAADRAAAADKLAQLRDDQTATTRLLARVRTDAMTDTADSE